MTKLYLWLVDASQVGTNANECVLDKRSLIQMTGGPNQVKKSRIQAGSCIYTYPWNLQLKVETTENGKLYREL